MTDAHGLLIGRSRWLLRQFKKQIWVRAALFSLGAVVTAIAAALLGPLIPPGWELKLAADSVDAILNILATSMLTVTTFALSIMVTAYGSATANVTPRSTKLLLDDTVAQNTLSTFLGSFLFSIVGIIGLAAGLYENNGRLILFVATMIVLLIITGTLLRWIDQLGKFGRVSDTTSRVEAAATEAAQLWGQRPHLGMLPVPERLRTTAGVPVCARHIGYVQHVDVCALEKLASQHALELRVAAMPGAFITTDVPLVWVSYTSQRRSEEDKDSVEQALRDAFSVADVRNFDQDPRYGLIVLSEIASRALSPAVNDPGTAINVLVAGARVIEAYRFCRQRAEAAICSRVYADDLELAALFFEFFNPIARDGAALLEVQLQLQMILHAIAAHDATDTTVWDALARNEACAACSRAEVALQSSRDREVLARACAWLQARTAPVAEGAADCAARR